MDTVAVLHAAGLFAPLPDEQLAVLAAHAVPYRLHRGQRLFREGEASEHLFVVGSGRLKVLLRSGRGDELLLAVVGPGDTLGELSVLDGQPRSASVEALEDAALVALPAAALRDLLASSPGLALAWARELSATVRRLTGSTGDLVFLDLPRRLAKLLLDSPGDTVDLGMTQSDVAARLGVARQSLNRALSALQARAWVAVAGGSVHLLDRPALERFARS